jgi:hypothetical protein
LAGSPENQSRADTPETAQAEREVFLNQRPAGLSVGDPAWLENPRPVLRQITSPPAPIAAYVANQLIGRHVTVRGKGTTLPAGRTSCLSLYPNPV